MASPTDLADALIAEGNKAEDSGRLPEACERYRDAVAAAPRYAKAHLNLGIGLLTRLVYWALLRGVTRRTQAWTTSTLEPR